MGRILPVDFGKVGVAIWTLVEDSDQIETVFTGCAVGSEEVSWARIS